MAYMRSTMKEFALYKDNKKTPHKRTGNAA